MGPAGFAGFLLLQFGPDLPEPDGLVRRHTGHHGVVGAGGEEEDTTGVARQVPDLHQRLPARLGIFPDGQLVVTEAVAGNQLPVGRVPHDAGDLTAGVGAEDLVHGVGLPHPDSSVHRASSCSEEAGLPGTPGHGLDSRLVLSDGVERRVPAHLPHLHRVVVPSTGQSLPVSAVRCQKSFKFYLFCSIPGSGWWRLEEFLHEDLKIGGCKIKRYFKMCLPVFIGSIKASFGSAF